MGFFLIYIIVRSNKMETSLRVLRHIKTLERNLTLSLTNNQLYVTWFDHGENDPPNFILQHFEILHVPLLSFKKYIYHWEGYYMYFDEWWSFFIRTTSKCYLGVCSLFLYIHGTRGFEKRPVWNLIFWEYISYRVPFFASR